MVDILTGMNRITLLLACLFTSITSFAQSPKAIEADLLKSFKKIEYWDHVGYEQSRTGNYKIAVDDSLATANALFGKLLKSYAIKYPITIKLPFKALAKERLDMFTASDSLFKIYCWDTQGGGTMHEFGNVLQYKSGKTTNAILDTVKDGNDYVYFYSKLYTFKTGTETYYLGVYNGIYSSRYAGQGIQIFSIANGKLNQERKIIKTATGLHGKIYLDYDFGSIAYKKVRPTIYFDSAKNTIFIPVIVEKGRVTNRYLSYKFTGKYFEKVKS